MNPDPLPGCGVVDKWKDLDNLRHSRGRRSIASRLTVLVPPQVSRLFRFPLSMIKSFTVPFAKTSVPETCLDAGASERRCKQRLICSLLLVLVTLALYNPLSRAPFLNYDDGAYVFENFHVRSGLNWDNVVWALTTDTMNNWHPLTWLSHCLDVSLFGLNPAGPHYVNVLLHAVNTVLLFLLLEASTNLIWRSLAVAALFAVHPLNVESVAWISERKSLLSMLFFLLAIAAYRWYARKPAAGRYLLVAGCFALGLTAKPQVITFPFALLLLDYWPLARDIGSAQRIAVSWQCLIAEKIPLIGLSAASAWITMKVQTSAMHLEFPLSIRLENAALAYVKYIARTVWPVDLALLYPHPGFSVNAARAAGAALFLLAVTVLASLSSRRYLLVGWLWFLGVLVPMIGLVQAGVQAMADRYFYIAGIGLFVIVCWGTADLLERWHAPRVSGYALGGVSLLILSVVAHEYIGDWKDNLTLWTHTLQVTQNNFVAEDSLAGALLQQGRMDDAVVHFRKAVVINPQDPIGTLNLGAYEQQKQNYGAAIAHYEAVPRLTQNPRLLALALTNLGYAYYSERRLDQARQSFSSALQQQPENPPAFLGLGVIAHVTGDYPLAVDQYQKALRWQASDLGYLLLAQALDREGQVQNASAARSAAARVSRNTDAATAAAQQLLRP